MPQIIKFLLISLFCFSFWTIDALQNKKPVKKKKEMQNKKLYDCKNYHKGRFASTLDNGFKILIIRETNFQIEYRNYPNDYLKSTIEWINDCKFKLKIIEMHDPMLDQTKLGIEDIIEIGNNRNKDFYESSNKAFGKSITQVFKD